MTSNIKLYDFQNNALETTRTQNKVAYYFD